MIVEGLSNLISDDVFAHDASMQQSIDALAPLFNKLCLTKPSADEVQELKEGGLNLFLNKNGVVVRLFKRDRKNETINHLYHEYSLPYIGHITFPYFRMQIMPGKALCVDTSDAEFVQKQFEFMHPDGADISIDSRVSNIGYNNPNSRRANSGLMIDTVSTHLNQENDDGYMSSYNALLSNSSYAQRIIHRFEEYDDLQQKFSTAWNSDSEQLMLAFWSACEQECLTENRLYAGWLQENIYEHEQTKNILIEKGNIPKKSIAYEARCA